MPAFPFLFLPALLLAACLPAEDLPPSPMRPTTLTSESPVVPSALAVVELFTSEGCSSCPPADDLLGVLAARENVIALAFHVDYWDYIGWRDPYAQPTFSERQRRYAGTLDGRVYTPQMIVDGTVGFVGSRRLQAEQEISGAGAKVRTVQVALSTHTEGDALVVDYQVEGAPADAVLHLAVAERATEQAVQRGENRGRTLHHTNVVRVFKTVAAISGSQVLTLPEGLTAADVLVAAYVQTSQVGPILGAARAQL